MGPERRRRRRYTVEVPVRLHLQGDEEARDAQLRDVSATGCFLRHEEASFEVEPDRSIAFGFVLPTHELGLVRGRVVRATPGEGFAIVIDQANEGFDELLGALAQQSGRAVA